MSTGPVRLPALRVKLPCQDEREFFARLADAIAEKGLRVPTPNLRPVGSRVRVVLEFRDGETVGGEGVVDAHLEGERPGMNVRLVRFERQPPREVPVPTPSGPIPALTPLPIPATPAASSEPPAPPAPESSFESLFEDEPEPAAPPDPTPIPRPPVDGTDDLEPLYDVPAAPAEATPGPEAAPAPRRTSVPPSTRRAVLASVAVGAAVVVAALAYTLSRRPATDDGAARAAPVPAPAAVAPAAAPPIDPRIAERIALADRRAAEARLAGPDGALEHLLAAKGLRADDPRVTERLALLADTLEALGARALERGDAAEARVHLAAASRAAPERTSISEKLEALANVPGARDAGPHRERGTGGTRPDR